MTKKNNNNSGEIIIYEGADGAIKIKARVEGGAEGVIKIFGEGIIKLKI